MINIIPLFLIIGFVCCVIWVWISDCMDDCKSSSASIDHAALAKYDHDKKDYEYKMSNLHHISDPVARQREREYLSRHSGAPDSCIII